MLLELDDCNTGGFFRAKEPADEKANQGEISESRVTKPCQALVLWKKRLLTSRLQAARLCAANEILNEDVSLIKTHKGHP